MSIPKRNGLIPASLTVVLGAGALAWYRMHPITAALWLERLGSR